MASTSRSSVSAGTSLDIRTTCAFCLHFSLQKRWSPSRRPNITVELQYPHFAIVVVLSVDFQAICPQMWMKVGRNDANFWVEQPTELPDPHRLRSVLRLLRFLL